MKRIIALTATALLALCCSSAFAAWTDGFETYQAGQSLPLPWTAVSNIVAVPGGYSGQGVTHSAENLDCTAYRETGSTATVLLTGRFWIPSTGSTGVDIGIVSDQVSTFFAKLEPFNYIPGGWTRLYFYYYGGGGNQYADISTDTWYDVKLAKIGEPRIWEASYRLSGTADWISLGSTEGNTGGWNESYNSFETNYVLLASFQNYTGTGGAIIDDVYVSASIGTISGQVTLLDYSADISMLGVDIQLRPVGSATAVRTEKVLLDSEGRYTINDVITGEYDIAFKTSQSLRKVVASQTVAFNEVTTVDVTLTNGDIDGDNELTSTDLSILGLGLGLAGDE